MRPPYVALLLLMLHGLLASPASGQGLEGDGFEWSSELETLGTNALLGGVSAGVVAMLRRKPVGEAFVKGFTGGTLVYAGKRIAVERWFGAGLVGRQVGLLGGSIVGNAGAGRGTFDRIAFGFGPVRGYVVAARRSTRWSVDVPAVAAAVWGIVASGYTFDPGQSVSSGALVFTEGAHTLPGTSFVPEAGGERATYVRAHERVHILQYDQSFLFWGDPFESWLARRVPALEGPLDHLEFNLVSLGAALLTAIYIVPSHADQPWEREAMYLGRAR